MTLSAIEVNRLKQAPTVEGVLPVVHARWSPRAFAPREVSPADLKKLFEAARAAFNIPEDFIAGAVIALGYQGEPSTLPDDEFLAAEIAPRTRRPWNKSFLSAWDEPFNLG